MGTCVRIGRWNIETKNVGSRAGTRVALADAPAPGRDAGDGELETREAA
jgi:hypothetical protein